MKTMGHDIYIYIYICIYIYISHNPIISCIILESNHNSSSNCWTSNLQVSGEPRRGALRGPRPKPPEEAKAKAPQRGPRGGTHKSFAIENGDSLYLYNHLEMGFSRI